jgi:hypothetical protein
MRTNPARRRQSLPMVFNDHNGQSLFCNVWRLGKFTNHVIKRVCRSRPVSIFSQMALTFLG